MIFDKQLMIADGLAHGGTPTEIDFGEAGKGPGEEVIIGLIGHSLAGADGFKVYSDNTAAQDTEIMDVTRTAAQLNAGVYLAVPKFVLRYLKVALTGTTTAGTWTCGIIKEAQTAV